VPLERWDVEERFDRELLFIYYQTSKLSNRYFPIIERKRWVLHFPKLIYTHPCGKKYRIEETIPDLAKFAIGQGTTYRMLKQLNPWLRSSSLEVKPGKSLTILLPSRIMGTIIAYIFP
jgi:uncharacterized protein YbaR (Trm112 family)